MPNLHKMLLLLLLLPFLLFMMTFFLFARRFVVQSDFDIGEYYSICLHLKLT